MAPISRWLIVATVAFGLVAFAPTARANDDGERLAQALEVAWVAAAKKAAPAVVMIEVERTAAAARPDGADAAGRFRNPFENPAYTNPPDGPFSGVIVGSDGEILTSAFNVSGSVRNIRVTLADGRRLAAQLLGRHDVHDLALLRVSANNLPVPEFRDTKSDPLRVGHFCAVIGRSECALEHTMTTGIVSALDRQAMGALQFDAQTNYGSTGGALIDLRGRLIGIANSIRGGVTHGQNSGVCFGLPMHVVLADLPDLRRGAVIDRPRTPFLGVKPDPDALGVSGVRIAQVIPGTGAAAANLRAGDVIVGAGDQVVRTVTDLRRVLQNLKIGDRVRIRFVRDGTTLTADVVLGEKPD